MSLLIYIIYSPEANYWALLSETSEAEFIEHLLTETMTN